MNGTRKMLCRALLLTAVVAMLPGCGVKSAPASVDGADYPRVYPALPAENMQAAPQKRTQSGGTVYTRRPAKDSSGVYTPPPPATEILAQ